MQRDIGDCLDRWSIAKLKAERIGNEENIKEFNAFDEEIKKLIEKYKNIPIDLFCKEMISINSGIWLMESAMRSGKDILINPCFLDDEKNKEILSIIGKNAILIRTMNSFRVGLKNIINKLLGEGFIDIKKNHMSE